MVGQENVFLLGQISYGSNEFARGRGFLIGAIFPAGKDSAEDHLACVVVTSYVNHLPQVAYDGAERTRPRRIRDIICPFQKQHVQQVFEIIRIPSVGCPPAVMESPKARILCCIRLP
jgi:hypothetical protein